jgi:hypothetical protein
VMRIGRRGGRDLLGVVSIIHELQKDDVAAENPIVGLGSYILADPPAIQLYHLRS